MKTSSSGERILTAMMIAASIGMLAVVGYREWRIRDSANPRPVVVEDWSVQVGGGHRKGALSAPVTFVVFSDFECPYCAILAQSVLPIITAKYPNDVAVLYRHWPLANHRFALPAAEAAECAAVQGKFHEYHDQLYRLQDSIGIRSFTQIAADVGIGDTTAFVQCLKSDVPRNSIDVDRRAVSALESSGTPTVLVNGMRLRAAPTADRLDSIVVAELRRLSASQ